MNRADRLAAYPATVARLVAAGLIVDPYPAARPVSPVPAVPRHTAGREVAAGAGARIPTGTSRRSGRVPATDIPNTTQEHAA